MRHFQRQKLANSNLMQAYASYIIIEFLTRFSLTRSKLLTFLNRSPSIYGCNYKSLVLTVFAYSLLHVVCLYAFKRSYSILCGELVTVTILHKLITWLITSVGVIYLNYIAAFLCTTLNMLL